ncbi:MAG: sporulation initiation factor Spo0A C-terminal domain-containing protein [Bacillota bacterium]
MTINRVLLQMAVPVNLRGFRFMERALTLLQTDPDTKITGLYLRVGREFGTSDKAAERQIRYAVEQAWERMPQGVREDLFGNSIPSGHRPTVGMFLRAALTSMAACEGRGVA